MYGYNISAAQSGLKNLSDDALQRRSAARMFDQLHNAARRSRWLGGFTGRVHQLHRLADAVQSGRQRYEGVQLIAMDSIIGTENRSDEFDATFRPVEAYVENRWVSLASAYLRGVVLPPVELLRVGDAYYVRDGHHRISVYRAFQQTMVEAVVIAVE